MSTTTMPLNGSGTFESPPEEAGASGSLYEKLTALAGEARTELTRLDTVIAQAQERQRSELEAMRERHRAEISALTENQKRARNVLRAAGEEVPQAQSGREPRLRTASQSKPVSRRALRAVLSVILTHSDEEQFSRLGISEKSRIAAGDCYKVFRLLRDKEIVRKAAKQPGTHGQEMFKIFDRETGERLLAEISDSPSEAPTAFANRLVGQDGQPKGRRGVASDETVQKTWVAMQELSHGGANEVTMRMLTTHLQVSPTNNATFGAMNLLTEEGFVTLRIGDGKKRYYTLNTGGN